MDVPTGPVMRRTPDLVAAELRLMPRARRTPRHTSATVGRPLISVAAQVLGVDVEHLRRARSNGRSVADVAADRRVDVPALVDAVASHAGHQLATEVSDGRLSVHEAVELGGRLRAQIETLVASRAPR